MTDSFALRLVAALRGGAVLARRPRGVVHVVADGARTGSGRWIRRSTRPVCGAHTAQLTAYTAPAAHVAVDDLRFCRRCQTMLPLALGTGVQTLTNRDAVLAAYRHLTMDDLALAASWCTTVEECHRVGRVALTLSNEGILPIIPMRMPDAGPDRERWDLEQVINQRRRSLGNASRSAEDNLSLAEARAEATAELLRGDRAQRKARAVAYAQAKQRRGKYLLPHERALLDSA